MVFHLSFLTRFSFQADLSLTQIQVLGKLSAFLPQLAAANEKLKEELEQDPRKAAKYDITNCEEEEEQGERIISMDVAFVPMDNSDSDEEDDE
jgi:hypothetical protein